MFMFAPQQPNRVVRRGSTGIVRMAQDNALLGSAVALVTSSLKWGLLVWIGWSLLTAAFGEPTKESAVA